MAHLITSDDYRFGRTHGKRVSVGARVNGFLKNMIEAIADSKMRRIERELALRGYLFDRSNNDWVSCNSSRAGIHKD
jgi:hypothetical protein